MLRDIIKSCFEKAQEQQKAEGYIKLDSERGFATIPLPGIDVPFHSWYLWAGVSPTVVQDTSYVDNSLRCILVSQAGRLCGLSAGLFARQPCPAT